MKKLFIFILLGLSIASFSFADTSAPNTSSIAYVYVFHLYFDNGSLVVDRDAQFQYDMVAAPYAEPVLNTGFPFHGDIISFNGQTTAHFTFDPRNGDANFNKGKISVKAPYVSDAQRVVFYNSQNQAVLSVPVDTSSFCNDDGICNADRGEDYLSCSTDCKAASLPVPSVTPVVAATTGSTSTLTLSILYVLIGLVLLGALWWFFKRRRPNSPLPPPPSLPTPPAPPTS